MTKWNQNIASNIWTNVWSIKECDSSFMLSQIFYSLTKIIEKYQ